MKKAMLLLGNGYEEVEALTVVDFLRRAQIPIDMVSITGKLETVGDHQIRIYADRLLEEVDSEEYDVVITPGGMPGVKMLASDRRVTELVRRFYDQGKLVAAICASPLVLEAAGISRDIKGTCFPGIEKNVHFKVFSENVVERDGNVITSRGPATAPYFALALIEAIAGKEKAEEIRDRTLISLVEDACREGSPN